MPFLRSFVVLLLIFILAFIAGGCREEGTIQVSNLSFQGVEAVPASQLKAVLATRESDWLPWGKKRYFDRQRFDADLKRIEAFYADRGYPSARVTSFDVKLNDKQDKVDLTIVVSEGDPIRVGELRFEAFDPVPEGHFSSLRERVPLKEGAPLDRQLVLTAREMAANELKDHGYPYAQVSIAEEDSPAPADRQPAARWVRLTFRGAPGPIAYFGPIEISGNRSVSDEVIRRQLTYRPGELFRRGQLQESQRKLYGLELFEFANVEVLDAERQPSEVRTRVTVTEGKHRRVNFGVGYGTEEKVRAEAQWRHLNFFGGARTAGVHGKWSSLDRGVRVDFNEPYFFSPHFSLGVDAHQWYADEPAYALNTSGGRVTVTHRASHQFSWSVSYLNEYQRSAVTKEALLDLSLRPTLIALGLDPTDGTQRGTLSALAFNIQRNTTPNLLNATRGYVASLHLEEAGRLLPGSYDYYSVSGEGRHYVTVAKRFVLANRIQFGSIDPAGELESGVPFFKRYFLGGSSSLRGWGRFDVSPLSGFGLPIGGLTMLEASSEVRLPIAGNFGGVLFVDAGNVWSRPWDVNFDDLRVAVGPGLRYFTPIGPVRFDFGYQVNPIDGLIVNGRPEKRRWRVHFSIGQAF